MNRPSWHYTRIGPTPFPFPAARSHRNARTGPVSAAPCRIPHAPYPAPPPDGSRMMIALQDDAAIILVYGKVRPQIQESFLHPPQTARMNNAILVASEVCFNLASWEGRASYRGQVGRFIRADVVYHGVINNIQGVQDERVDVDVDRNRVLHQSLHTQLEQLLLLAASPHLHCPP